jgi:PIN domain nuclease of toxin-antitoxin system
MYLLDSHVLIWALLGDDRLPVHIRKILIDPVVDVWVSASTVWELHIKNSLGKLELDEELIPQIERSGFKSLSITFEHAKCAGLLPKYHSDPFDRMLIAQAMLEGLKLITADKHFRSYDVPLLYF